MEGKRSRKPIARWLAIGSMLCVTGVLAVAISACGGGGSSSSESTSESEPSTETAKSSTPASAEKPTGEPIKVVSDGPFTSSASINFGEIKSAAEATVAAINAEGGINGRPLELETCDDEFLPDKTVNCYTQFTGDSEVVAAVSGYSLNGDAVATMVEKAELPIINEYPKSKASVSNPQWFQAIPSQPRLHYGAGKIAAEHAVGSKKVVLMSTTDPGVNELIEAVKAGAEEGGANGFANVPVTLTTTDYSAMAAQIMSEEPGGIVLSYTETGDQAVAAAARQSGFEGPIVFQNQGSEEESEKIANSGGEFYTFQALPPVGDEKVEGVKMFHEQMEQYGSNVKFSEYSLNTWFGYQILRQVLEGMKGPITREAVTEALNKTSSLETYGLTEEVPGWFTKKGPIASEPRIVNTGVVLSEVNGSELKWNGEFTPTSGK